MFSFRSILSTADCLLLPAYCSLPTDVPRQSCWRLEWLVLACKLINPEEKEINFRQCFWRVAARSYGVPESCVL